MEKNRYTENSENLNEKELDSFGRPYLNKVKFTDKLYRGALIGLTCAFGGLGFFQYQNAFIAASLESNRNRRDELVKKLESFSEPSSYYNTHLSELGKKSESEELERKIQIIDRNLPPFDTETLFSHYLNSLDTEKSSRYLLYGALSHLFGLIPLNFYYFCPKTKKEEKDREQEWKQKILKAKLGIK